MPTVADPNDYEAVANPNDYEVVAQPAPVAPIIPRSGAQMESLAAREFLATPESTVAGDIRGTGDQPVIPIPRIPQQEGVVAQLGAGAVNAAANLAETFETPQLIASLPVMPMKLTQLLFGGQALSDIKTAYEEAARPETTIQKGLELGGRALTDALFGVGMVHGAVSGLAEPRSFTPKPDGLTESLFGKPEVQPEQSQLLEKVNEGLAAGEVPAPAAETPTTVSETTATRQAAPEMLPPEQLTQPETVGISESASSGGQPTYRASIPLRLKEGESPDVALNAEAAGISSKPSPVAPKSAEQISWEERHGESANHASSVRATDKGSLLDADGNEIKQGENIQLGFMGGPADMPEPWTLVNAENKFSTVNYKLNPSVTVKAADGTTRTYDFANQYSPRRSAEEPLPVSEGGAGTQALISKPDLGLKEPVSQTSQQGQAATNEPLIFGYTFDQIKSAQQGGRLVDAIRGSPVKPTATEADYALLEKHGLEGLQKRGSYGVLDRLKLPFKSEEASPVSKAGVEPSAPVSKIGAETPPTVSQTTPEGQAANVPDTEVSDNTAKQIDKSSQIQSPVGKATEIVLEPHGSVLSKLSFGDEKKVFEVPSFTSRTTSRGKQYDFSLSEFDLPDGRKRLLLSAGGDLVDAGALVKLTDDGPEIQMLHAGKTGFEGLGGTLVKEITKRYGKPVVPKGSPLSPSTARYAAPVSESGLGLQAPVSKEAVESGVAPTEAGQPEPPSGVTALTPDSRPPEVGPNVKGFEKVYGPGEIKAGDSVTPEEIFRSGQADLASGKDPYAIADRARTGDVSPKEIGLLSAEHDRLLHEAAAAEGTPDYEAKYQQAKDFAQNMLKPAGTKWHQTGMGLQVKAPIDLSSLTGFRAAFEERFGKEMTPDQANSFSQIAKYVARAKAEDAVELGRTAERVRQRFKGVKDISFEDAVKSLHDEIASKLKDCNL